MKYPHLVACTLLLSLGCDDGSSSTPDSSAGGGNDASAEQDGGRRPDAGPTPDAGPVETRTLFAIVNNVLVAINPDTAALVPVIELDEEQPVTRLAFVPETQRLFGLSNTLDAPAVLEIDPCEGTTTDPIRLTMEERTIHFVEGFTYVPSEETFYVAGSLDGAIATDRFSESLLSLDVSTGIATYIAPIVGTAQDEADDLFNCAGGLCARDTPQTPAPCEDSERRCTSLYQLDPTTGRGERFSEIKYHVGGIAYSEALSRGFAWHLETDIFPRHLFRFDLESGGVDAVGETHSATDYEGDRVHAMVYGVANCILR